MNPFQPDVYRGQSVFNQPDMGQAVGLGSLRAIYPLIGVPSYLQARGGDMAKLLMKKLLGATAAVRSAEQPYLDRASQLIQQGVNSAVPSMISGGAKRHNDLIRQADRVL